MHLLVNELAPKIFKVLLCKTDKLFNSSSYFNYHHMKIDLFKKVALKVLKSVLYKTEIILTPFLFLFRL